MKILILTLMFIAPFAVNANDQNGCKSTADRAQEMMRVRQYTPEYLEPYSEIIMGGPDLSTDITANAQEEMTIIFLMTSMTPVEPAIVDKIRVIDEFTEASYLSCMGSL